MSEPRRWARRAYDPNGVILHGSCFRRYCAATLVVNLSASCWTWSTIRDLKKIHQQGTWARPGTARFQDFVWHSIVNRDAHQWASHHQQLCHLRTSLLLWQGPRANHSSLNIESMTLSNNWSVGGGEKKSITLAINPPSGNRSSYHFYLSN